MRNLDDLKVQLLAHLRTVLPFLLPTGKFKKNQFLVGNVQGHKGESLKVELRGSKAGMWHDFATGEGGDILDLWAAVKGKDSRTQFPEVLQEVQAWLGGAHTCTSPVVRAIPIPQNEKEAEQLGVPTHTWYYRNAEGNIIAAVERYDTDKGKIYLPWDVNTRKYTMPELRPLYNIPGIMTANKVVLVEGEKAADALIKKGIMATTVMGGANAPVDKVDWSPLKGRHVVLWPDNDEPGKQYAHNITTHLRDKSIDVASLEILLLPQDKPEGWDAANAVEEGIDVGEFMKNVGRSISRRKSLNIQEWTVARYRGSAPTRRFLVEGLFPMKCTSLFAAMGDTGKGLLLLDLALKVASSTTQTTAFGPPTNEQGTVVIFSAEDDEEEIHRRLESLDPHNLREGYAHRLLIIPLPNAGGIFPIVQNPQGKGPVVSPEFEGIRGQLLGIKDLKLIVFDPLASFMHVDVNADPSMGAFATGVLANLATETGAAVIVAHHMRKPPGGRPITSPEQARDAIRGTSALVDGVRCAYALWPASQEHQDLVCNTLNKPQLRHTIYQGAVVKANGPADKTIRTYWRSHFGLLEDITSHLQTHMSKPNLADTLKGNIANAARRGHPFTHTGDAGVYRQRHRLASVFHHMGKHSIERIVQNLLNTKQIVKGKIKGSKEDKWLDVPNGPFARGVGEFRPGAEKISENL